MKRVGRPLAPARPGAKTTISLRLIGGLKGRLMMAAGASGRSMSEEAVLRLEQSFRDEWLLDEIAKLIGKPSE